MFIQQLQTDPAFYASAVCGMIVSIVLHELAHGWTAIWQGDNTPRETGHMTPNPVTHMGPLGIAAVCFLGIGWGMMPVNPSRFRSKYGDAIVAAAGPAMNLLLAILLLTALALWLRIGGVAHEGAAGNFQRALLYIGFLNIALVILNLAPVPPLDGCRVLANLNRGFDRWLRENEAQYGQMMFIGYIFLIIALNRTDYGLFNISLTVAEWWIGLWR